MVHFLKPLLTRTPEGGEIFKLYYQWSPLIAEVVREDEVFKKDVKEMVAADDELVKRRAAVTEAGYTTYDRFD